MTWNTNFSFSCHLIGAIRVLKDSCISTVILSHISSDFLIIEGMGFWWLIPF